MSFELIDISVAERHPHPKLDHRITGRVRAVLSEKLDGRDHRHEILVPVWTDISPAMSEEDIDLALLVKAAGIVGRVKQKLHLDPISFPHQQSEPKSVDAESVEGVGVEDTGNEAAFAADDVVPTEIAVTETVPETPATTDPDASER